MLYKHGGSLTDSLTAEDVLMNSPRYLRGVEDGLESLEHTKEEGYGVRMEWRVRMDQLGEVITNVNLQVPVMISSGAVLIERARDCSDFRISYLTSLSMLAEDLAVWDITPAHRLIISYLIAYLIRGIFSGFYGSWFHHTILHFGLAMSRRATNLQVTPHVNMAQGKLTGPPALFSRWSANDLLLLKFFEDSRRAALRSMFIKRRGAIGMMPREDVKLAASDVFDLFRQVIWKKVPSPHLHMKKVLDLGKPTPPLSFAMMDEYIVLAHICRLSERREPWRTRFDVFFPPSKSQDRQTMFQPQAHSRSELEYIPTYFSWLGRVGQAGRAELEKLFEEVDFLPSTMNRKRLWRSETIAGRRGVAVVRNLRNLTLC
jgi:hypothetical protein